MKTSFHQPGKMSRRHFSAFTLVEMLITVGIFMGIFVGVMVGLQLFGMRVYTLAATKLSATADARKTLNALRGDIRSAKLVYVGTYTNNAFSRIPNGLPQTGNALEIFAADANDAPSQTPVIYYQDSSGSTKAIRCVNSNTVSIMANYVTNYFVFAAEDYQAQVLSSYDNNPVIRVTLDFSQWEYPIACIGTNGGINAYNFYRLQTRVSRRAKE